MRRLLILSFLSFIASIRLHAQEPKNIQISTKINPNISAMDLRDGACSAGTFKFGTHLGQSNDFMGEPIFLCFNDSLLIDHNGDATFMDPNPTTAPGVGYVYYKCPPQVPGPTIQAIMADPCVLDMPMPINGLWVATGDPSGDLWLRNVGVSQNFFNQGKPIQIFFAPITIDDFDNVAFEMGSCTNVDTSAWFSVVYLNAITVEGITANVNNDCIGRFQVKGGWPEFDLTKRYTINIFLESDPSVKAIVHTPAQLLEHGNQVNFSVPEDGIYTITIEDGKSCMHTFQMNMTACNPVDNVVLDIQDVSTPPGTNICVPITAKNISDILSGAFNLFWDTTYLTFTGINNPHPALAQFTPATSLNQNFINDGYLGFYHYDPTFTPFNIPDGEVFMEICFDVKGQLGDCTFITAGNLPTTTGFVNSLDIVEALTIDAGRVCVGLNPLTIKVTPHDTCNADGSITIKVTGAEPPYDVTYVETGSGFTGIGTIGVDGGTFTANGLAAGNYMVIVVDNMNVVDTVFSQLNISSLGASLDLVEPTCNGKCDGSATVVPILNGVPASNLSEYTFKWTNNPATTALLTGLCAGQQYTVTVTNTTLGCTTFASSFLTEPTPVDDASVLINPASCSGIANGSIALTMGGGTPLPGGNYTFSWAYSVDNTSYAPQPSMGGSNNPQLHPAVTAGFYKVTVTDANQCTFTNTYQVGAGKTIDLQQVNAQNVKCFGGADGVLNVQLTTSPNQPNEVIFWTFVPQTPNSTLTPGPLSHSATGLQAGTYTVTAIDTAGCSITKTFTLTEPPQMDVQSNQVVNPTCAQKTDGAISLKLPGGGVPPFMYTWSNGSTTQNISNLPAGDYTVTVKDANNCTSTKTFTIALPPAPPIVGIDSVSVECGADGCLTAKSTGANLSFTWKNLTTGTVVNNTAQICNLAGGIYEISVKDALQCESKDTVVLAGKVGMSFTNVFLRDPLCAGDDNGSISPSIAGGTTPYSFQWSPGGSTTQTLFGVGAGSYSLTVSDANDCTLTGNYELKDPTPIGAIFPPASIVASECSGECSGAATVIATPTGKNYVFSWEDQPSLDDSTRTDLCPGFVSVTITDPNNCFHIDSVFIGAPAPVVADTFYTTPASCDGGNDGSATVSGGGGNGGPYTFDWGPGFPFAPTINNLDSGQYIVTIFDNLGCTGTHILVVDDPEPLLLDTLSFTQISCGGSDNGEVTVQVSGGNTGSLFSFLWTNGQDTVANTATAESLPPGRYFVTVTDSKGCTATAGPFVFDNPLPVFGAHLPWEELNCYGEQTTLYIDTIYGGSGGPFQYSLDYGVLLDKDFPVSLSGGEHVITYYDRTGCALDDTIQVIEPEQILISFTPPTVEIELGDSTQLRPLITGAAVDSFIWAPAADLSDPLSLKPYALNYNSTTFTLTVFDSKGCSGTGSVRVSVDPNRNVYLPNIFHPGNTSGLNDRFNPLVGSGVDKINFFRIYDRWGELQYERNDFFPNNNDFSEGWDGSSRGKRCNPGVYVYILEVDFLDGRTLLYRGDITLLR